MAIIEFFLALTSLSALDLDPQLQENRQKYLDNMDENDKRTKEYLAMVRRRAEEQGILT